MKNQVVIGQFGNLNIESQRIRYVEAMILARILPGDDIQSGRLETALGSLPRSTMYKVITTLGKLGKAHGERTAILLKGFQDSYITQGILEASNALAQ